MNNYKLLLCTETEDGGVSWLPLFLDASMIDGFYVPILEDNEPPSINILIGGGFMTVMQEEHIQDYLNNRFSNNLIKE